MKAKFRNEWYIDSEIIVFDDNEKFSYPKTFKELSQCDNVIIGKKSDDNDKPGTRYVQIDKKIYKVTPEKVYHPSVGVMHVLKVN